MEGSDKVDVAAFSDSYLPTINGVSYSLNTWAENWNNCSETGSMDVVFPESGDYRPKDWEHPVPSLPFPFYEGYRMGAPYIPSFVRNVDIVHVHSLFSMGAAGLVLSIVTNVPLVVTYHTPFSEYANYVFSQGMAEYGLRHALERYEAFILDRADIITTPSMATRSHLRNTIGTETNIEVLSNGVDTEFFKPVNPDRFLDEFELSKPVVGYTGRHGTEKNLGAIIDAAERLPENVTVVIGGNGPDRERLEQKAAVMDVDVEFVGFLDRNRLPEFYSALDVFMFPSPVETEGLVAMEAMACGTPVIGANKGALPETINHGKSGRLFPEGDTNEFAAQTEIIMSDLETYAENCIKLRSEFDIQATLTSISSVYATALGTFKSNNRNS